MREYGPAQAGDHEYYNGYSFKKNEFRGSIEYRLPFFREKEVYRFEPIYERVNEFTVAGNLQVTQRNSAGKDVAAADAPRTGTESADLVIDASYGITDWFTLSNAFSYKKHLYKPSFYPDDPYWDDLAGENDLSNHVFTEQATLTFNVSPKKRLGLSFLFARQTDDSYPDGDERAESAVQNWILLFHYQGELDS
jgi:hypothetical protein